MATRKLTPKEPRDQNTETVSEADISEDDALAFPSSSPDKKILTGKALLESGLVGIWKDRTDIGDSLTYARKLRRQASKRSRD